MLNLKKNFVSIKPKIILYFLLFTIIPIVLLWLFVSLKISSDKINSFELLTNQLLDDSKNYLNMLLTNTSENIIFLSQNKKIKNLDNSIKSYKLNNNKTFMASSKNNSTEKKIFSILQKYSITHPYIEYAYIGTRSGGFIQYPEGFIDANFDPTEKQWYKQAINNLGKVVLSDPYIPSGTNKAVLTLSYAISNNNGEFYGVLGIDIPLNKLTTNVVKNNKFGKSGFIMLIDSKGTILTNPKDSSMNFVNISALNNKGLSDILNKSVVNKTIEINNKKFICNTLYFPETSWTIIALIEKDEYLKSIYSILIVFIIVFLFSVLILVVASILITRTIINPINQLKNVSIDISNGNLNETVNIKSNDEIGELANYIEIMRIKINDYINELKLKAIEIEETNKQLEETEIKHRILIENTNDIIFSYNSKGIITAVNKSFSNLFDLKYEAIIGKCLIDLFCTELNYNFLEQILKLSKKTMENYETVCEELLFISENKLVKNLETTICPVIDKDLKVTNIVVTMHDITEAKNHENHIKHLAFYDLLTKLPNRVLFVDKLKKALINSLENNTKGAVIFLDLDNFKNINDTLGHSVGDELLKNLGNNFKTLEKENITIARFGGDEFTFLIDCIDNNDEILSFINNLNTLISKPIYIDNKKLLITSSMGITIFPGDACKIDDILKNADTAMYTAKELGKNSFKFFSKSMNEVIIKKVEIINSLREAISNNELVLYYQPQIDLKTNKIKGFEALIRWIRNDGTIIPPSYFIPIAEKTGLIIPIGEWVIENACLFVKKLQTLNLGPIHISINLSVLQLKENGFNAKVLNIMDRLNINPKLVDFEITESMLIDSLDSVIDTLTYFTKKGITISLDDFGTGYSSLSYLTKLPISYLKIDKSFIDDITLNTLENKITGSIIELSHKMGIKVVAEGVESKEQLNYLIDNKCDIVQGYLFSKPLPEEEAIKILNKYK